MNSESWEEKRALKYLFCGLISPIEIGLFQLLSLTVPSIGLQASVCMMQVSGKIPQVTLLCVLRGHLIRGLNK